MSEEPIKPNEQETEEAKRTAFQSLKSLIDSVWVLLKGTLDIREGVAKPEETIAGIHRDIDFRGYNLWILIFSIFIASIGLNTNSTAVVIGAMLISPLMGPIIGIGLSVGTNDWTTLKRSLKSLAIAVLFSIITSTIYFSITPLSDATSELLNRTRPIPLDIFIALFGGLAGIVAGSRKEKTNVIPGVAIATALMPPLCTAGYGLATGQFHYFLGAFYLFIINSIFISIATYAVVRFLKYPLKEFVDPVKEKKAKRYTYAFIVIVIIPSAFTFYNIVQESLFDRNANKFVKEVVDYPGSRIRSKELIYSKDSISEIVLDIGGTPIPKEFQEKWAAKLGDYNLDKTRLLFIEDGTGRVDDEAFDQLAEENYDNIKSIASKNEIINQYKNDLEKAEMVIKEIKSDTIPIGNVCSELKIQYEGDIQQLTYSNAIIIDFFYTDSIQGFEKDTIPTFFVKWRESMPLNEQQTRSEKLERLLKKRLKLSEIRLSSY